MGKITKKILSVMDIPTLHCNKYQDLNKITDLVRKSKKIKSPVAILIDFNLMKAE